MIQCKQIANAKNAPQVTNDINEVTMILGEPGQVNHQTK